jgi:hypothetical protein
MVSTCIPYFFFLFIFKISYQFVRGGVVKNPLSQCFVRKLIARVDKADDVFLLLFIKRVILTQEQLG